MRLERLAKDPESYSAGGCQAIYLADNGMFTVQAVNAADDANTMSHVENLLPGEVVGFIKPEIVVEAVQKYLARQP